MVKKILSVTDPILRKKSKPVKKIDKKVLSLIADLKDTLVVQENPQGVGLAASQIGKNFRVFAMKPKDKIKIIINPVIVSISKQKEKSKDEDKIMEGCLSLPHFYGPLKRPQEIKIKYLTEKGEKRTEVFKDFPALIVQHEIDHLDGIIFVDRLLEKKKPLYELKGDEWHEVEL